MIIHEQEYGKTSIIDEKNEYVIDVIAGGDCCDYATYEFEFHGNQPDDLSDWEFAVFPDLDAEREYSEDRIAIINPKTGATGDLILECSNNGYYSADYSSRWTDN